MRNFNRTFSIIRQKIRKNDPEAAIGYLNEFQEKLRTVLDSHARIIETQNKKAIPVDKRYVEVGEAEGSTIRLTINANTGRFTVKFPKCSSEKVKKDVIELVVWIANYDQTLPPVTLRGAIRWDHTEKGYNCFLQSESKKFQGWILKNSTHLLWGENKNV